MNNEKQTAVLALAENHSRQEFGDVVFSYHGLLAFAAAIQDAALEEAAAICEERDCEQGVFQVIRALKGKK